MAEDARRPWLAGVAALSLTYALFVGRGGAYPIPLAFLTLAILAAGAAVLWPVAPRIPLLGRVDKLLGFGLAVQFALLFVWPLTNPLSLEDPGAYLPFWAGIAIAAAVALLIRGSRPSAWLLGGLVVIHLALGVWTITTAPDPFIDVWYMQGEGARALVEGVNPYLPIYENIHGADTTYYGPGLVVDGELTIGFPYPPLSLLLVLPGELLLGDPRYVHLLAMGLTAIILALARPGRLATRAALLYLFNPWTFFMVAGSWTEPLAILFVAVVVLAAVRAPRFLGWSVGLLIAIKQYLILGLPLAIVLLALKPRLRLRIAWQAMTVLAITFVPFALWDVGAFAWSTIGSLAGQVFRADSLSYLAVLPGDWGPRLSLLGFALLLPVAGLVAWRAPRSPFGFAASLGLLLLVFFAFSRQGSANYHFAVIGALWCAVACSAPKSESRSADIDA